MITTYAGENDGARNSAVRRLIDEFTIQYGDMGIERFDAEEAGYETLVAAVQSLPFLASRKLVVIKNPDLNKEFTEKFEAFTESVSSETDVLLVEGRLDKRTAFYRLLKKQTEYTEFSSLDENGLVQFAVTYTQGQGGKISAREARHLVQRTGLDQIGLENELNKLLSYDNTITSTSIERLTVERPQSRIFDLLDAAFSGNAARTLTLYADQRAQGEEPQKIISMLVWQLYIFAVCKAGQRKSATEIVKVAKISPYVVEKSLAVVRHMPLTLLKQYIQSLRELDVRSKSATIAVDDALQAYLLSLAVE